MSNSALDKALGGTGDVKAESMHTLGQLNAQRDEAVAELQKLFDSLPARGRELDKQLQEAEDAQDEAAIARVRTEIEQVQEAWIVAREELMANGIETDGAEPGSGQETEGVPASPGSTADTGLAGAGDQAEPDASADSGGASDPGAGLGGGLHSEVGDGTTDLQGGDPSTPSGPGSDASSSERDREPPEAGAGSA